MHNEGQTAFDRASTQSRPKWRIWPWRMACSPSLGFGFAFPGRPVWLHNRASRAAAKGESERKNFRTTSVVGSWHTESFRADASFSPARSGCYIQVHQPRTHAESFSLTWNWKYSPAWLSLYKGVPPVCKYSSLIPRQNIEKYWQHILKFWSKKKKKNVHMSQHWYTPLKTIFFHDKTLSAHPM